MEEYKDYLLEFIGWALLIWPGMYFGFHVVGPLILDLLDFLRSLPCVT